MITLFLGAGTSKPFGYPTTTDFIQISNEKFKGNSLYSEIISFFNKRGREDIDIELILWELDKLVEGIDIINEPETFKKWFFIDSNRSNYNLWGNPNQPLRDALENIKGMAKQLKLDINRLVYDTYWKEPDPKINTVYEYLFKKLDQLGGKRDSDKQINIFTTNYDLIIERYFEGKRQIFSDGFAPMNRRSYCWDLSHYGDKKFKLYKLHGSIDWKKFENDEKIYCIPAHDFTKHEDNVILYPGFKGEPEIEPFKTLHKAFADSLLSTRICIFIGFSFRDEYINEIISKAINQNPELLIHIWNPMLDLRQLASQTTKIVQFLKYFGEDVSHIDEFINEITRGLINAPSV
jgi:hypothetical protein